MSKNAIKLSAEQNLENYRHIYQGAYPQVPVGMIDDIAVSVQPPK